MVVWVGQEQDIKCSIFYYNIWEDYLKITVRLRDSL